MNCVWTLSNWSMFWPLKTMFPALRVFLLFWQHDLFFEETKNQTNATVASANSSDQARDWLFWAQWGNLKLWGTCRRYDMKSGTASCLLKHLVWSGFCRGFYRWFRCVPRSQRHFFAFDSTTFFQEKKNQTNATVASANSSDQVRDWLFWAQWGNLKLWGTCRRYDMKSGTKSCLLKHLVFTDDADVFPVPKGIYLLLTARPFFRKRRTRRMQL